MISCRISKYDPQYRGPDGVYKKNEWTSICDIGGVFDDGVLTRDEYLATESRYIGVFRDILEELNIKMLCLSDFEVCNNIPEIRQYKRNKVLNVDASCLFLTNCLREEDLSLSEEFFLECMKYSSSSKTYLLEKRDGFVFHGKWLLYAPKDLRKLVDKGVNDYDAVWPAFAFDVVDSAGDNEINWNDNFGMIRFDDLLLKGCKSEVVH